MQPIKYLNADHPYLVIKYNRGGPHLYCSTKYQDARSMLKKIQACIEKYSPFPGDKVLSKQTCKTLKNIANEIVVLHSKKECIFNKKYNQSLRKRCDQIASSIDKLIAYHNMTDDKKKKYVKRLENQELRKLVRNYRYKLPSMGGSYLFML